MAKTEEILVRVVTNNAMDDGCQMRLDVLNLMTGRVALSLSASCGSPLWQTDDLAREIGRAVMDSR